MPSDNTDNTDNTYPPTYQGVIQVMNRLLGDEGCPWDRQQTPLTLKDMLLEECYELMEAIERNDTAQMVEELGDVLYHILFQTRLGEDADRFTPQDVFGGLIAKLTRRHPHVFGSAQADTPDEVLAGWDAIKRSEQTRTDASILDGVPRRMPALAYAQAIQTRAGRAGFDWDDIDGVLDKITEEIAELQAADSDAERQDELGDLLFTIVNTARWLGMDAETALRQTNSRFYLRFKSMEQAASRQGKDFTALSMQEKEALWEQAKAVVQPPTTSV